MNHRLPTPEEVTQQVLTALSVGWLTITKVNSERGDPHLHSSISGDLEGDQEYLYVVIKADGASRTA